MWVIPVGRGPRWNKRGRRRKPASTDMLQFASSFDEVNIFCLPWCLALPQALKDGA
jgi:hypothetical protein